MKSAPLGTGNTGLTKIALLVSLAFYRGQKTMNIQKSKIHST